MKKFRIGLVGITGYTGMELARLCNATLEEARGRIELLLGGDKSGPIESRPFFEDGEGEGRGTSSVSLRSSAPPPAEPEHGATKGGKRAPLFDDDDALPF